ncbi:MAG: DUF2851 family protein [Lentisphaeria bacterium]|nr:DUF2851 family protein [Lentisphaeria bacterium]
MEKNGKYPVRKTSGAIFVKEPSNFYEVNLRSLWASLPEKSVLELENGKTAIVLFPGNANAGEGPDFLGAKIVFGRTLKEGDIAIHCRVSDFIRHGHVADPAYDNVILQGAKLNDLKSAPPRKMEKIPLFLLDEKKIHDIREKYTVDCREEKKQIPPVEKVAKVMKKEKRIEEIKGKNIPCKKCERLVPCLAILSPEEERKFFLQAAKEKIEEKGKTVLQKLISAGTELSFKELLFQFAGSNRNEKAFAALFITYSHYPEEKRKKYFQSILWGESGLLPDPLSIGKDDPESILYVKKLWQEFWQNCTGNKMKPRWDHSGSLYGNTPEKELVILCHLLEKFSFASLDFLAEKLCVLGAEKFREHWMEELEITDPFWEYRNNFQKKKKEQKRILFSYSRKILFFVDVLIPSLLAYAKLHKDRHLLGEMEKLFLLLPAPDNNSFIRKASVFWYGEGKKPSSAAEYTGWLHIYQKYCSKMSHDCAACVLGD